MVERGAEFGAKQGAAAKSVIGAINRDNGAAARGHGPA